MCIGSRPVPGPSLHASQWRERLVCSTIKQFINGNLALVNLHMNRVCQTVLKKHYGDAVALYVGSPTMSAAGAVDLIK